jgi:Tol biopolymer transport system component
MALSLDPRFVFSYLRPGTLARAPLTGGAPRENLANVNAADWTPDGKELAVAVGDPKGTRLECPLGHPLFQSEGIVGKVRVSPDGQWLAFWDYVGQSAQVGIVPRKGGARRVLSGGWRVWSVGLAWSVDSREVWFTATRGELQNALYAVDLSGHTRLVSRFPSGLELFDIGLDGRVLAASVNDRVGVITLAPDSVRERDLSWLDTSFLAGFSTDGRMVTFTEFAVSREEGAPLYLRHTDGSPAVRLGEGFVLGFGEVSPDRQWVIAAVARPPSHLVLVPTGTGSPHDVANGPIERYSYQSVRWLPDSRRFVFIGSDRDRRNRLYVGDLDGGVPRPITPPDGKLQASGLAVSPDGRWAAAIVGEGESVLLFPIEGGAARPVPGRLDGDLIIGWSADRNSLYTYRIGDLPAQIYRIVIETGDRRTLREISAADPAGVWRIHPIRITADGRSCAYSYARRLSDLYVFEGLR